MNSVRTTLCLWGRLSGKNRLSESDLQLLPLLLANELAHLPQAECPGGHSRVPGERGHLPSQSKDLRMPSEREGGDNTELGTNLSSGPPDPSIFGYDGPPPKSQIRHASSLVKACL